MSLDWFIDLYSLRLILNQILYGMTHFITVALLPDSIYHFMLQDKVQ